MKEVPVIYTLEPIGLNGAEEATGTLFFCSGKCREAAITERRVDSDGPIALGVSAEYETGTVCDECAQAVTQ